MISFETKFKLTKYLVLLGLLALLVRRIYLTYLYTNSEGMDWTELSIIIIVVVAILIGPSILRDIKKEIDSNKK